MKGKFVSVLAAVVLLLALGSLARADNAGQSCTVNTGTASIPANVTGSIVALNFNNMGLTGMEVDICVADNGTNTYLTFAGIVNGEVSGVYSIQEYGISGNDTFVTWSDPDGKQNPGTTSWSSTGPKNMDGFGTFNVVASATDSPDPDTVLKFSDGTAAPTAIAIHIKFNDSCTGYASSIDGNGSNGDNAGCSSSVPEPGTLALFGTGALALAGFVRRRLFA